MSTPSPSPTPTPTPHTLPSRLRALALTHLHSLRTSLLTALHSGTYTYPLHGILYLLSHRPLWSPLLTHLLPTLSLSILITAALFFLTYLPQTALLALTGSGVLAPLSAAVLVLGESASLTNLLARRFVLREALVDVFDGTLVARGQGGLVARAREVREARGGRDDAIARLGRVVRKGSGSVGVEGLVGGWVRSLVYLPLNFVPVVGSVMYVVAQGRRVGDLAHARYFELKGWSAGEREEWLRKNRAAYTGFGIAAFVLEIVPFASLAFSYTNTVGAALWASNLEKSMSSAPTLRDQASKEE
ncbi:hypothetical protein PRK78_006034 [Emydomyces testavorans]|uniref:Outer spore wall protein RRT8 n=1 Tax=Emydomyces testavorans TaxID=2070801 RepID=A0AAF0DMR5_9EURO|nr:hypothetical protein PRK78_006034 [Emydomyces testavorans]